MGEGDTTAVSPHPWAGEDELHPPPTAAQACTQWDEATRPPHSFSLLEYYLIATSSSYQDILLSVCLSSSIIIRLIFPFTPILVYRADIINESLLGHLNLLFEQTFVKQSHSEDDLGQAGRIQ